MANADGERMRRTRIEVLRALPHRANSSAMPPSRK
jgi:hypothetical protein